MTKNLCRSSCSSVVNGRNPARERPYVTVGECGGKAFGREQAGGKVERMVGTTRLRATGDAQPRPERRSRWVAFRQRRRLHRQVHVLRHDLPPGRTGQAVPWATLSSLRRHQRRGRHFRDVADSGARPVPRIQHRPVRPLPRTGCLCRSHRSQGTEVRSCAEHGGAILEDG